MAASPCAAETAASVGVSERHRARTAFFRRSRNGDCDWFIAGVKDLRSGGAEPYSRGHMARTRSVTALLGDWSRGNRGALNQLLPLVYAELRRIAARQLGKERVGHSLQPTALVHEVYLRLVDQRRVDWQDRAHFFGVSAQMMRRILVDHARRHGASKRGSGVQCVALDDAHGVAAANEIPVLALDHALSRLESLDPKLARVVELRAFGGLTIEETAHVLDVSTSTAKREWRTAKAWLNRELGSENHP
jgi:RNA polymerase sigma-70 factor (ECF subfamily)